MLILRPRIFSLIILVYLHSSSDWNLSEKFNNSKFFHQFQFFSTFSSLKFFAKIFQLRIFLQIIPFSAYHSIRTLATFFQLPPPPCSDAGPVKRSRAREYSICGANLARVHHHTSRQTSYIFPIKMFLPTILKFNANLPNGNVFSNCNFFKFLQNFLHQFSDLKFFRLLQFLPSIF